MPNVENPRSRTRRPAALGVALWGLAVAIGSARAQAASPMIEGPIDVNSPFVAGTSFDLARVGCLARVHEGVPEGHQAGHTTRAPAQEGRQVGSPVGADGRRHAVVRLAERGVRELKMP
jgi:hypothetical protein